ncbi:DUF1801 domain-containing protein [Dactylosporangium sp. NPDC051484]|uniref:DUF1801 domain-containing protein n=1 Tax=Dactylosporangium sp. NPDC051484 TaxID=3154942 RepID=UPI00344B339F
MTDIDEYVAGQLTGPQQAIVAELRTLMARHAPGTREVISRGSLAWEGRKLVAIVSRSKTHITLAFARGAEFIDPHGRLEGIGKTTRHVKLKSPSDVDDALLVEYVRQAVAFDQG